MPDPTANAGAHGGENPGGDEPFRVFKTQAEFDAHAAGIRAAAEKRAVRTSGADLAEVEAMKAELEQRRQADLEAKGKYEEALKMREATYKAETDKERTARTKAETALRKVIIEDQLKALAAAHGAYDPEDVVVRLKDRIGIDDDYQVRVCHTPGGAVQDGVTMEQAVIELLKTKPHLAKAAMPGRGSGSAGGASMTGFTAGTPAQREAQAKIEDAQKRLAANPRDHAAADDMMAALLKARQAT